MKFELETVKGNAEMQLPVLNVRGKRAMKAIFLQPAYLTYRGWAAIGIRRTYMYEGLHQAAFEGVTCVRKIASTAFVDVSCGGF
jgi:hypothetical protein